MVSDYTRKILDCGFWAVLSATSGSLSLGLIMDYTSTKAAVLSEYLTRFDYQTAMEAADRTVSSGSILGGIILATASGLTGIIAVSSAIRKEE